MFAFEKRIQFHIQVSDLFKQRVKYIFLVGGYAYITLADLREAFEGKRTGPSLKKELGNLIDQHGSELILTRAEWVR